MRQHTLGLHLIEVLKEASIQSWEPHDVDGPWRPLPANEEHPAWENHALAEHLLAELSRGLKLSNADRQQRGIRSQPLGSKLVYGPTRRITRGYLQPAKRVPLLESVPVAVVQFIVGLPGGKDFLLREHHGPVGWHYHYLDRSQSRSNVILSWDTKYAKIEDPHPLFVEMHGEGKAKFKAKPDRWGHEKKRSMHRSCARDLDGRWPLSAFRCASTKATAVWPENAVLMTSHATKVSSAKGQRSLPPR